MASAWPAHHATTVDLRWTPGRKLDVVNDVQCGRISFGLAVAKYGLSEEELQSWLDGAGKRGIDGLKVGQLQAAR
jgi:hypothetical protein